MRYSQMSPEQRALLFDRSENYPLRIHFLGKTGLLSAEAVALLRQHGVEFEVDDKQVEAIFAHEVGIEEPGEQPQAIPYEVPGLGPVPAAYPTEIPAPPLRLIAGLVALLSVVIFLLAFLVSLIKTALRPLLHRQTKPQPKGMHGLIQRIHKDAK